MRRAVQGVFALAASVLVLSASALALDQTPTGFYYPLGRNWWSHGCGGWLERDPANGGCYFSGYYHIGEDMMANEGDNVYLVGKGRIVQTSYNGWGSGNVGLAVVHRLVDGSEFIGLYGHVRNVQIPSGVEYPGGTILAKIGPYSNGNHLHFGVRPGNSMPGSNWGLMPNSSWPSTNGFVDPVDWIRTRTPEGGCTGPGTPNLTQPSEWQSFRLGDQPTLCADNTGGTEPQTTRFWVDGVLDTGFIGQNCWQVDRVLGSGDYTWHGQKQNGCGTSGEATRHFHINFPPPQPGLLSPANGAVLASRAVNVSWSDPGDPDNAPHNYRDYRIHAWKVGGGWDYDSGWGYTSTTFQVNVPDDGQYRWQVAAGDGWNDQSYCADRGFLVDTTPPVTTTLLSPSSPNGENGWYVTSPSVTLAATDPNGSNGSGVARTDYSIDSGAAVRYTGACVVAGDGSHVVRFWSTDVAGNVEAQKSIAVAVDTAPPAVTSIDEGEESASTDTLAASWEAEDAASGICQYEYAIGSTHCGQDIVGWTSTSASPYAYRQNLNLEVFKTYYFKVRATDCAGHVSAVLCSDGVTVVPRLGLIGIVDAGGVSAEVRSSDNYLIADALGQFVVGTSASTGYAMNHGYWCGGIEVLQAATLAEARSLPDDSRVRIALPIPVTVGTDRFLNRFYIEPETRVGGLLVRHVPGSGPGVSAGDAVTVVGKMATVGGERCLDLATVESKSAGICPEPLSMVARDIGWVGLYNIGLLVRTCGWVTYKSADGSSFYIEDGSATWDGSGHYGLRVALTGLAPGNAILLPSSFEGRFVTVTGISSVAIVNGQAVRCVRPREQGDVQVVF